MTSWQAVRTKLWTQQRAAQCATTELARPTCYARLANLPYNLLTLTPTPTTYWWKILCTQNRTIVLKTMPFCLKVHIYLICLSCCLTLHIVSEIALCHVSFKMYYIHSLLSVQLNSLESEQHNHISNVAFNGNNREQKEPHQFFMWFHRFYFSLQSEI